MLHEQSSWSLGGHSALYLNMEEFETNNQEEYRIRKLTPKECWRLMDFEDNDFEKAKAAGVSDSQLYKQAGNSIVVGVLYQIFTKLYEAMPYLFDDLKVGSYFSGIGAFEKALDRLYANGMGGGQHPIVYDSFNSRMRNDTRTIGTLTTMCGDSSLRAGVKLIEPHQD